MAPAECPRCDDERRAERMRVAMSGALALAVLFAVIAFIAGVLAGAAALLALDPSSHPNLRGLGRFFAMVVVSLGGAGVGARVFSARAARFAGRAATPRPAPAGDAHYREAAPPGCARHPFAG